MKLQTAMIFGENMILQRQKPIPVWGRSVGGDTVTVTLGEQTRATVAEGGEWRVTFDPMEAAEQTTMTVSSAITGESLSFRNVAIGEVWLAGGQSNMEFLLKYDVNAAQMRETPADPSLRFFRYPQAAFLGQVERDAFPEDGFWRLWNNDDNINHFSGPSAYMGRQLRKVLGVPVGFVGCNWGGSPATAWTDLESTRNNPKLQPVMDWYNDACAQLDLMEYERVMLQPIPEDPPERKEMFERFMMGEDMSKLMASGRRMAPPAQPAIGQFTIGPKSTVRPAGLYEYMLCKVAPYAIRGAIWYQGEDDDARGWTSFYAESMKTLIESWRALWGWELPFLQVELAPFGRAMGAPLHYAETRAQQRMVPDMLPQVHNACIMDVGDERLIHPRRKKQVGERLALLARKYVYGESDLLADSPRLRDAQRSGSTVTLTFDNAGDGLYIRDSLYPALQVRAGGAECRPSICVTGDRMTLQDAAFADGAQIEIAFAEQNYCVDTLYSSSDLPAFPFTVRL